MLRLCSLLVLLAGPVMADLAGVIRVVDGDTVKLGGQTVRLHGIDAPEADQFCGGEGSPMWACGAWVSGEVRARYDGRRATCKEQDRDRYGRIVAKCFVEGRDIGADLVEAGLVFAFRRYSWDYDLQEKRAAVAGRGLHGVGIDSPSAFRANGRRGVAAQARADAPQGCVIKGNISRDGKRIYHMPGQEWYDRTRISEAKGERWFCSESEARNAGWRRARR